MGQTALSDKTNDTSNAITGADAEQLFRKYGPMVIRRCRQLLSNADEAADAAQDVFVKLVENKSAMTAEFPSSLLFRIATNHCMNLLRERSRRGGSGDDESLLLQIASADCEGDIETRTGARKILAGLFKQHPASSRTIAVLHLFDGMTLEETAREVGMSVSGVRKRLRALRQTLKSMEDI